MRNRENAKYFKWGVTGAAVVAFGLVLFLLCDYSSDGEFSCRQAQRICAIMA